VGELPVGISFYGRAWSEGVLLEIAYGYEQGTGHRRAPRFLNQ
jgi:amidase